MSDSKHGGPPKRAGIKLEKADQIIDVTHEDSHDFSPDYTDDIEKEIMTSSSESTGESLKSKPSHTPAHSVRDSTRSSQSGQGKKKTFVNADHLLSVSYPELESTPVPVIRRSNTPSSYLPYKKERFVQANFRFLMDPNKDYSHYLRDPDCTIDWEEIQRVLVRVSELPTCAICLSEMICPRIIKCGHIYCWACLLQLVHSRSSNSSSNSMSSSSTDLHTSQPRRSQHTSGDLYVPCPICLREKFTLTDSKAVLFHTETVWKIGDKIDLCLVQRPKSVSICLNLNNTSQIQGGSTKNSPRNRDCIINMASYLPLPSFSSPLSHFNRLLLASTEELLILLSTDLASLMGAAAEAQSAQDISYSFLDVALSMLREEINSMGNELNSSKNDINNNVVDDDLSSSKHLTDSTSSLKKSRNAQPLLDPIIKPKSKVTIASTYNVSTSYFFFQITDGQHIFLHPTNVKYLTQDLNVSRNIPEEHAKTLSTDPMDFQSELNQLTIFDLETHTMDEAGRKKWPWLSHLPLSCQFKFVFVDLTPVLQTHSVRHAFAAVMHTKTQQRQQQEAKELQIERLAKKTAHKRETHHRATTQERLHLLSLQHERTKQFVQQLEDEEAFAATLSSDIPTEDDSTGISPGSQQQRQKNSKWASGSLITKLKQEEEEFPALVSSSSPFTTLNDVSQPKTPINVYPPTQSSSTNNNSNSSNNSSNIWGNGTGNTTHNAWGTAAPPVKNSTPVSSSPPKQKPQQKQKSKQSKTMIILD